MNKRLIWQKFKIISVSLLCSLLVILGGKIRASQIQHISGLTAADATIVDARTGKVESSTSQLNKFGAYNVSYKWSIPDGVPVNNGDTTTFTIPNNVQVAQNQTCNVYDQNKQVVGSATIKAGSQTGIITFNGVLENKYGRIGTLQVGVTGKHVNTDNDTALPNTGLSTNQKNTGGKNSGVGQIPTINKVGWYDKANSKRAWWQIVANLNGEKLDNPVITDNMGSGMELVPSSLTVKEGQYVNGVFQGDTDVTSKCTISVNGNKIIITLPNGATNNAIAVEYQTEITASEPSYSNSATISADNVSQSRTNSAILPDNISGTVIYYQDQISVRKIDIDTGDALSNASFTLFGPHNEVLKTEKTNANGIAIFKDLADGTYYIKETGAPAGYDINSGYQMVTLDSSQRSISITIRDRKKVSLSSSSASTSSSVKSTSSSSASTSSNVKSASSSSASTPSNVKSTSSSSASTPSSVKSTSSSSASTPSSVKSESSSSVSTPSSVKSESSSSVSTPSSVKSESSSSASTPSNVKSTSSSSASTPSSVKSESSSSASTPSSVKSESSSSASTPSSVKSESSSSASTPSNVKSTSSLSASTPSNVKSTSSSSASTPSSVKSESSSSVSTPSSTKGTSSSSVSTPSSVKSESSSSASTPSSTKGTSNSSKSVSSSVKNGNENKQQKGQINKNKLPQTGENNTSVILGLGATLIVFSGVIILKEKDNF